MMEVVDLGASKLSDEGVPMVQCQGTEVADGESPGFGDVPLMCALGLAAMPAESDESGAAQGIVTDGIPGFEAACVAAFDPRCADTYKRLGPGDTAVFSTGKGYDSRLLCKKQSVSLIVGNDAVIAIDRAAGKIAITGFGATIELTSTGISLAAGGAMLQIGGGSISMRGNVVLGGAVPTAPVLFGNPSSPQPTPGVFLGV